MQDHGGLLNDDTVLRIVSELSWNERLKLKLVSQQFRRQVDKSLVGQRKLIVFHRLPIIADGQFKFSEEDYQANDCLYITDMKLFFESNLKNLQDLRKLIILSATPESCQLSFKLPKLEHLELYHLTITNCDLLSSPALTSFYNQDSVFKSCTPRFAAKRLENLSISSEYFVDVCQLLNEIDYLEIPENIEDLQLDPMLPLKARRIKINSDLKTAVDLLEKFECIERLDVNLTDSSLSPFAMPLMVEDLRELFKKNSKAPLFIFGAKVTRRNYHRLMDFLEGVVLPRLDIESNRVTLQIDCPLMLEDLEEEDEMFGAFYRVNEALVFEDLHLSNMLFNKLSNVRQITLCLTRAEWYHENDRSNQLLLYFPKLEALEIEVKPYVRLSNRFLDTIPVYCGNLVHLRVQCFDEVSFGFLSQLTKLKYLMITAYHSWRYRVVMRLLKQLKYLSYFRLSFLKPENGFAKEDLSEYRSRIYDNHTVVSSCFALLNTAVFSLDLSRTIRLMLSSLPKQASSSKKSTRWSRRSCTTMTSRSRSPCTTELCAARRTR